MDSKTGRQAGWIAGHDKGEHIASQEWARLKQRGCSDGAILEQLRGMAAGVTKTVRYLQYQNEERGDDD